MLPLSACRRSASPRPPPAPDPDVALTLAAADRERALIALYDRAVAAARPVVPRAALLGIRAEHAAHLAALTGAPTTSPSPTTSPTTTTPPPVVLPAPALADLRDAESAAAGAHSGAVPASSRTLAQVLASLSAAEAAHRVVLG